jgi:hypothetical protein
MKTFSKAVALATVSTLLSVGGAFAASFTLGVYTALTTATGFQRTGAVPENVIKQTGGDVDVACSPARSSVPTRTCWSRPGPAPMSRCRPAASVWRLHQGIGIWARPPVRYYDEARKMVTSPLFEEWVEKLRKSASLQVLSFNSMKVPGIW